MSRVGAVGRQSGGEAGARDTGMGRDLYWDPGFLPCSPGVWPTAKAPRLFRERRGFMHVETQNRVAGDTGGGQAQHGVVPRCSCLIALCSPAGDSQRLSAWAAGR